MAAVVQVFVVGRLWIFNEYPTFDLSIAAVTAAVLFSEEDTESEAPLLRRRRACPRGRVHLVSDRCSRCTGCHRCDLWIDQELPATAAQSAHRDLRLHRGCVHRAVHSLPRRSEQGVIVLCIERLAGSGVLRSRYTLVLVAFSIAGPCLSIRARWSRPGTRDRGPWLRRRLSEPWASGSCW